MLYHRQRLLAEEGLEVDLAEEVPADDGGEGEEQHAHGDEGITEPAELLAEGQLGQSSTGGTASEDAGGEDHHSGEGEDHEGVNKDADHGDLALFLGVLYLSQSMGMRSGAHTGLIAEQTSCHTDAHCLLNADTSGAATTACVLKAEVKIMRRASGTASWLITRRAVQPMM